MGRSMSAVAGGIPPGVPASASFFDAQLNRHFGVLIRGGQIYESEWETDAKGHDVFRQTEAVEWLIGAGENGIGALVRRGNRVFEAPVTYYTKTGSWALSPGFEQSDRGFSRPIDASCITCHSGKPNPVENSPGEFRVPAFEELAIGCENCHGPGTAHVQLMRQAPPAAHDLNPRIVNPGKLSPWLADNICMSCHQTGDARVQQPGRLFQDFRPGQPLDEAVALFIVPPTPASPPSSDLVQQYFQMMLSKCYRSSGQRLSCITCHNPHAQPSRDEAPDYYRAKCLVCHTDRSCTAPAASRRETTPSDNCIACHMPKREVTEISHSSLTNHRIISTPDEPFPDLTFHLSTPGLADLVHVNAIPGQPDLVAPTTLLQAYGQVGPQHRAYMQRYFDAAKTLEASTPNDAHVLEALAAHSLQLDTPGDNQAAMEYLSRAIERGSTTAWDFEMLGTYLLQTHRLADATVCLRRGIQRAPYDAKLYSLLAEGYVAMNHPKEAIAILRRAVELFPQMDLLRAFLRQVEETGR